MPSHDLACRRCGSPYLHRSRTRTWWQRLLKQHTRLRRYTCGDCGHRAWHLMPVEPAEADAPSSQAADDGRARASPAVA